MNDQLAEESAKAAKTLRKDIEEYGRELAYLQRKCRELGIPVLIVIEGLSAAGKGTIINQMIQPMDPRGFKVSCIASPNRDEQMRPFLWRFWRRTPSANRMAIFDRSWYRNLLDAEIANQMSEADFKKAYSDVRAFERQMKDGGTVILKFFLEITKKEQAARLTALQGNPATAWRVSDAVLQRHARYHDYVKAVDQMFRETDLPGESPWHKIPSNSAKVATSLVLRHLVDALSARVKERKKGIPVQVRKKPLELPSFSKAPSFKNAVMSQNLSKDAYLKKLESRQSRIQELHHELYRLRIPLVIVYEGWDASGKGGNIRRLTEKMDPRGYEVIPVSAPNDVEKAHHYLWRFWTEFPKAGHVTIFDRSWYGRVLVERVEGFCSETDWKQAYNEINEMEENFRNFGSILVKFWVHIDKDEQLNRFKAREENPHKSWKLHEEDWRNREKWDLYEEAAEEMFLRTHAPKSPWTIIEGNCKRHARIKALDVVIDAIEKKISGQSK
jgi:polyphosphate:AMP phosphotransferase